MDKSEKSSNQCIKCDVGHCTHNNKQNCGCKLKSITVTPTEGNPEAHFCKNYKCK